MSHAKFNIGVCAKDLKGDLLANLKWLSDQNFNSFQIWKPQIDDSKLTSLEFLKIVEDLGLSVSAVGGGPNLVDPSVAKESVASFKSFMDLSVELKCKIVSAETKILPATLSENDGWKICLENLSALCEYAKSIGVVLAIECAGPCFINHHLSWHTLYEQLNTDVLKVNFDAANIAWARIDPVVALNSLKDHIVHTHIKDIRYLPELGQMEQEEDHDCVMGEGIVDYRSILKGLLGQNYHGAYCIEMHSGDQDRKLDILASKSKLLQYLNEV